MRIILDPPIAVGNVVVAALVEHSVRCSNPLHARTGYASKRPIAIMVSSNGETSAYSIEGEPFDSMVFEQKYPGIFAKFETFPLRSE